MVCMIRWSQKLHELGEGYQIIRANDAKCTVVLGSVRSDFPRKDMLRDQGLSSSLTTH